VLDNRPVDLIHAHGTGTVINDAIELAAIESVIGPQSRPSIYSHKGALGHSLGAAGLVAVVINCLCHKFGVIPPNIRTTRPMPMDRLEFSRDVTERPVNRSVSIASGFGGPIAVVSLIGTADERR
jgi:3-oxoacyl-[acyl-carrier-protein] synthase II